MPVKQDVVEVIERLDHCSIKGGNWEKFEDIEDLKPLKVHSSGWLVRETKDAITIVPTWHEDDGYGEILIVKKCIVSRQKFKLKSKDGTRRRP